MTNPTRPTSPSATAIWLATVIGNLYLLIGTFVGSAAALVVALIEPRGRLFFLVTRWWSRGVLWTSGLATRTRHEVDLDPATRYVFMANHESLYDIPVLLATLPVRTRFLAKKSLFRIPIFGWALKAGGFITIDRENRTRVAESFALAVERLRSGASLLVFPEGTRSAGRNLKSFQRGGFLLALKAEVPIVPVGIQGTYQARPKGGWAIHPGPVSIRYGRPIATTGLSLSDKGELMSRVRAEIVRLAELDEGESGETAGVG